jgi:hypothetical protein
VAVVEVALGNDVGHGGWNHGNYALFLIYGYLAGTDARIAEAFRSQPGSSPNRGQSHSHSTRPYCTQPDHTAQKSSPNLTCPDLLDCPQGEMGSQLLKHWTEASPGIAEVCSAN